MSVAQSPSPTRGARATSRFGSSELFLGLALCTVIFVLIVFRQFFQTHDPYRGDLLLRFLPVGTDGYILGTDNLGRDLWSRLLEGVTWSISAASIATLVAFALGATAGLVAAQFPGYVRTAINQVVDTALSFPSLVIAIIVVAAVGRGFWPLTLTLGLVSWPVFARVVYAESLSLIERDYVVAARTFGAQPGAILAGHILPGLRPTLTVMLAFHFADMLMAESALSFLGLGAPVGVPTWGNLLQESRDFLFVAPWLMVVPAGGIVVAVITANLVGDGLAILSRQRGRRIDI